ncbi:hypothetical protein B9Z55_012453 [Caenorhabditis nigoni]|uniref:DUF19 domain-containing protein n=1 Tax=Caenorhabditis nigoni TaxID=1611254 RepID=A0A2G5TXB5_9PELO|nr:hypothetical protein B9Z55_012453 [Caenorhabditis nigoni]
MIKLLLLIAFSIILVFATIGSSRMEFDSGQMGVLDDLFNSENDTPICKRETEIVKDCLEKYNETTPNFTSMSSSEFIGFVIQKSKYAMECIGEIKCKKLALAMFVLESGDYAMEKIHNGGQDCWNEENLQTSIIKCAANEIKPDIFASRDPSLLFQFAKPIAKCAALQQVCDDVSKMQFLKGATAFGDAVEVAMTATYSLQQKNRSYIENFNKKFNAADFDHLLNPTPCHSEL